jgi:hypothetical protein
MIKRTGYTWSDALISTAAIAIVVVVILAADIRVREQAQRMIVAASSTTVAGASSQVHDLGRVLFLTVKERSLDHGPVMVFCSVAVVLVLAMVKS